MFYMNCKVLILLILIDDILLILIDDIAQESGPTSDNTNYYWIEFGKNIGKEWVFICVLGLGVFAYFANFHLTILF